MNWRGHIIINEAVLSGKPVVKGTRLSVDHIVTLLASGWNEQHITKDVIGNNTPKTIQS